VVKARLLSLIASLPSVFQRVFLEDLLPDLIVLSGQHNVVWGLSRLWVGRSWAAALDLHPNQSVGEPALLAGAGRGRCWNLRGENQFSGGWKSSRVMVARRHQRRLPALIPSTASKTPLCLHLLCW